ncbi:hypothetical protein F5877DRAFT_85578 [Lentinula edodes]|nr:hypothetical protein F5877DRAFT_85578 [Lentinula edodes]
MNDSSTALGSPSFSPIHYIQSPVLVLPASVCLPSRLGSHMNVHPNLNWTPSHPHCIMDLNHISASAYLIPEIQNVLHSPPQWVNPPRAPEDHPYPMYYAPYPIYQHF